MLVELRDITKRFGQVVACDHIDLAIRSGQVLALLGENGAGKSTVMNILYGLYQPDTGQILIDGEPTRLESPAAAIAHGIGMVHQHFMLVSSFSVAENVALGNPPRQGLRLEAVSRSLSELSTRFGLQVDPGAEVGALSVGAQQRVEILRVLYRGARTLIFDEPTAVLAPRETEEVLTILERLKAEGCAIVLITHKLEDVMRVADRVSVLRDGRVVAGDLPREETSPAQLARLMVGREPPRTPPKAEAAPGEVVLRVEGLAATGDNGLPALHGVSFELRAGEILGIAAVAGNGQEELVEVLAGLRPASGAVRLFDQPVLGRTAEQLREVGVAHIPQDRHRMGLLMHSSILENLAIAEADQPPVSRFGFLQRAAMRERARRLLTEWAIRPADEDAVAGSLSGGNQQKVVLARELSRDPALILAAQPVRGLDVSAIATVHAELLRQRERGAAILLVSTDLDEILAVSDRIAVMHGGAIVGLVDPQTDIAVIGRMMAGDAGSDRGRSP